MNYVLTCGGTAGHINPALAVAGRLRELMPDSRFLFLGAEGKMEMDLVPRAGYDIKPLKITNIARGRSLSALAHNGLGNQVTALEHIKKAVSMEPDNYEYLQMLRHIENGGTDYRRQAGNFRGFTMRGSPCTSLLLCWFLNLFCCRGFICC